MLVHRRVIPSIKFARTHLYTWVERGTVRVKCLAQEHNTTQCPRKVLEPGALAPESSVLTMRPPRLAASRRGKNFSAIMTTSTLDARGLLARQRQGTPVGK